MGPLLKTCLVFVGGGLGATARYWLGGWAQARSTSATFPYGTLVVNVTGSLLIGVVLALVLRQDLPLGWRLFLAIGVLGGFTTFSSFAYETVSLVQSGDLGSALANVVGTNVLCLVCCWLGVVVVRAVLGG